MSDAKATFSIRIDGDIREALEKESKEQDRSMSWLINKSLRETLIERKKVIQTIGHEICERNDEALKRLSD